MPFVTKGENLIFILRIVLQASFANIKRLIWFSEASRFPIKNCFINSEPANLVVDMVLAKYSMNFGNLFVRDKHESHDQFIKIMEVSEKSIVA